MNDCDAIPLYTAQARDEVIDPDFSSPDYGMAVSPYEEPVDQDLSVMPDTGAPLRFLQQPSVGPRGRPPAERRRRL